LYQDAAMLSKPDALKALRASFKKERVVMLPDIYALLDEAAIAADVFMPSLRLEC